MPLQRLPPYAHPRRSARQARGQGHGHLRQVNPRRRIARIESQGIADPDIKSFITYKTEILNNVEVLPPAQKAGFSQAVLAHRFVSAFEKFGADHLVPRNTWLWHMPKPTIYSIPTKHSPADRYSVQNPVPYCTD